MANFTGKYFKVWKLEDKGNFKIADLGDSDKDKQNKYINFTWFRCMLVSKAAQLDIGLKDTIEIKSGKVTMEKYNDKWSPKVVIFDAEVMTRDNSAEPQQEYRQAQPPVSDKFTDDIPF